MNVLQAAEIVGEAEQQGSAALSVHSPLWPGVLGPYPLHSIPYQVTVAGFGPPDPKLYKFPWLVSPSAVRMPVPGAINGHQ